jgi:hypothetical protein
MHVVNMLFIRINSDAEQCIAAFKSVLETAERGSFLKVLYDANFPWLAVEGREGLPGDQKTIFYDGIVAATEK